MAQKVVPLIHVPDVRATVDWYTRLGFTVTDTLRRCLPRTQTVDSLVFPSVSFMPRLQPGVMHHPGNRTVSTVTVWQLRRVVS